MTTTLFVITFSALNSRRDERCRSCARAAEPQLARKLEGLSLMQQGALILVNDDDFGITGERTRGDVMRGAGFGRREAGKRFLN